MHRSLLAVIALFTVPVAFSQSIEVASCRDCKSQPLAKASPARIAIRAKCSFPDGTIVAEELFVVDASLSAQEKRAAAERACQPIMDAASAKCDDLANEVDAMKSEWRVAALHSSHERELATAIKKAIAAAPSYCK